MSAWPSVALHELAEIERDVVEATDIGDGTLYVGLENIQTGGEFTCVRPVSAGELASSKFAFSAHHLLYGKLRPYLAKVARPNFEGVCSTDILPVLPGPKLDRDYLAHFLLTPSVVALASSRATGANLPRLSPRALAELCIPLPSVPEQRRIADVLDRAGALRAKRRTTLALIDKLAQSIFVDMFGDPIANPMGWPKRALAEFATVTTGNTPSRSVPGFYGSDIEWIKSDNINTPHYYLTAAAEGLSAAGKGVARVAPPLSILVTCIAGSPACIGNAAMTDREVAFNQQINAVVPTQGDPHFIYAQLRAAKALIRQAATSSMKGMVSKSRFERIALMFPPVSLQREFASRIRQLGRVSDAQLASSTALNALFASLQHRAFLGEL